MRNLRRSTGMTIVIVALGSASCGVDAREQAPAISIDTASLPLDSGQHEAPSAQDTSIIAEPAPAEPSEDAPAPPPVMLPSRPRPAPIESGRLADVVFGVAEIQNRATAQQGSIYAPAQYLRVLLGGTRQSFETMTNGSGEYFFERVPAGNYNLVFLTPKEDRRIFSTAVQVTGAPKMQLPDVHIPLDSVRSKQAY